MNLKNVSTDIHDSLDLKITINRLVGRDVLLKGIYDFIVSLHGIKTTLSSVKLENQI